MLAIKRKHLTWVVFMLFGVGYFSTMSNLDTNYFWKSLIIMMPIQIAAIIYMTYLNWSRN